MVPPESIVKMCNATLNSIRAFRFSPEFNVQMIAVTEIPKRA